jgi:hypothetical protein
MVANVYTTLPRYGVSWRTHTTSMAMLAKPVTKRAQRMRPPTRPSTRGEGTTSRGDSPAGAVGGAGTRLRPRAAAARKALSAAVSASVPRNPSSSTSTNADTRVPAVAPARLAT